MGIIKPPNPSLLFAAVTHNIIVPRSEIEKALTNCFGKILIKSESFDFNFTSYYEKEMGKNLFKFLVAFENLDTEDKLPVVKLKSDALEKTFLDKTGNRQVNIDPGFLSESRVVLASTKNFSHRIHIGNGIFGEITLLYQNKEFVSLPWTFPDYKSPFIQNFLFEARKEYVNILKGGRK
ncbi:MAG: DUF4416 family protein [Acidobacteriota bacterium]|nr:DUF4416 family protein [Thermoanaerobaculaceae bacterium]